MKNTNKIIFIIIAAVCISCLVVSQFFIKDIIARTASLKSFCLFYQFLHANAFHAVANLYALYITAKCTRLFPFKILLAYVISVVVGYFVMYFSTVGISGILFALTGMEISARANSNTFNNNKKREVLVRFITVSLFICIVPTLVDVALFILHKDPFLMYKINSVLHITCLFSGFTTWRVWNWISRVILDCRC